VEAWRGNVARPVATRVPGRQISNVVMPIPPRITRLFREGSYVPYTFLTDDALRHAHDGNADGTEGVQLRHGVLVSASKDLSRAGEEDMQYQGWCQASERHLDLVKRFIPQDYPAWVKHNVWLVNQDGFKGDNFKLYLIYDISIRYAATEDLTFDMSKPQELLLAQARQRFQSDAIAAAARQLFLSHIPPAMAQTQSAGGPTRTNTARAPSGPAAARPANRSKTDKDGFCFRCGRRDAHHTKICPETTTFGGTTPLLRGHMFTRTNDDAWSDKNGKQYCYRSNTSRGCTQPIGACRYIHACTLCGITAHFATACSLLEPAPA
jgi:hypothetical protein